MNRELQRWTLILSSLIFLFGILGAFVPQWIYLQPYQYAFGLRQMCLSDGACGALNYHILSEHVQCRSGCDGNGVMRRFRAVEAWMWIAAASSFLTLPLLVLGFNRDLLHTARFVTPLLLLLGLSTVGYIIAVSIFGSTLQLHSNPWECPYARGCFYWGASSIAAFTGMSISAVALFLALGSIPVGNPRTRGALLAWTFPLAVASTAFALGAVLSPKWVILSYPYQDINNWVSIGPLNTCVGADCGHTDLHEVLALGNNNTCSTVDGLRARFAAGETFLILGWVTAPVIFLTAWLNWPVTSFGAQLATLTFFIIGTSAIGNAFDWYIFCGFTYCDYYQVFSPVTMDCTYGFAFASAVTATILAGLLPLIFLFWWCCRPEDRGADTTTVTVTTIAQPESPTPVAE